MASAPMPALKSLPYFSRYSRYSFSVRSCFSARRRVAGIDDDVGGEVQDLLQARGDMSSSRPMRLGMPLKYQMWDTGAASSMWPMRSRRTLARVTSTPQRSQMMPL